MTDRQWLKAIEQYSQSGLSSHRRNQRNAVLGGASELAHLLEKCTKAEPKRFSDLAFQFSINVNTVYFDAILRGLSDAQIDLDIALDVCKRFHELPNRPCGRWISHLIGQLAHLNWPQEAFDILSWYALNDSDPTQDSETNSIDYLTRGINSIRGSAVCSIAQLIFADKTRTRYFQKTLDTVVQDDSIAVRTCATEALIAVLNYDRDLAVQLFKILCNMQEQLLETHCIEDFLYYTLSTHFQELLPILEKMLASNLPKAVQAGAQQACLYFLTHEDANTLAEKCLFGSVDHQEAMAKIFAFNLSKGYQREFCERALIQLFNNSEKEVRFEASQCFAHLEETQLGSFISLAENFIQSPAFEEYQHSFTRCLEKSVVNLPELTLKTCDKILDANAMSSGIDASSISRLILREYTQSSNVLMQSKCLDIIDRMAQLNVFGLDEILQVHER